MGVITTLHIISSTFTEFLDYSIVKVSIFLLHLLLHNQYIQNMRLHFALKRAVRVQCKTTKFRYFDDGKFFLH